MSSLGTVFLGVVLWISDGSCVPVLKWSCVIFWGLMSLRFSANECMWKWWWTIAYDPEISAIDSHFPREVMLDVWFHLLHAGSLMLWVDQEMCFQSTVLVTGWTNDCWFHMCCSFLVAHRWFIALWITCLTIHSTTVHRDRSSINECWLVFVHAWWIYGLMSFVSINCSCVPVTQCLNVWNLFVFYFHKLLRTSCL